MKENILKMSYNSIVSREKYWSAIFVVRNLSACLESSTKIKLITGKKFGRSSNFYNHKRRIHLGIKKFKCYICGIGFVKAANLDAHLLIHCDNETEEGKNELNDEEEKAHS